MCFLCHVYSVRYHSLHPNYIHDRLKSLGKQYQLRVLLVLVDTVSFDSQSMLHYIFLCVCVFVIVCIIYAE